MIFDAKKYGFVVASVLVFIVVFFIISMVSPAFTMIGPSSISFTDNKYNGFLVVGDLRVSGDEPTYVGVPVDKVCSKDSPFSFRVKALIGKDFHEFSNKETFSDYGFTVTPTIDACFVNDGKGNMNIKDDWTVNYGVGVDFSDGLELVRARYLGEDVIGLTVRNNVARDLKGGANIYYVPRILKSSESIFNVPFVFNYGTHEYYVDLGEAVKGYVDIEAKLFFDVERNQNHKQDKIRFVESAATELSYVYDDRPLSEEVSVSDIVNRKVIGGVVSSDKEEVRSGFLARIITWFLGWFN